MSKFVYVIFAACLSVMLSGCASTSAVGKRLVELEKPVDKIDSVVHWVGFSGSQLDQMRGIAAQAANEALKDLVPRLSARTKEVFAANGIEGRMQIWSGPQLPLAMVLADAKEFPYLLLMTPTSSSYQTNGGHVFITMSAVLFDRGTKKSVWKGEIGFAKAGLAIIDDKVTDDFLMTVLGQLHKDGVISLKNGVPVAPEKKKLMGLASQ